MKQRNLLTLTQTQLRIAFEKAFPFLKQMALNSNDQASFTKTFSSWLETREEGEGKDFFATLLQNEGACIHEWSRDESIIFFAENRTRSPE